MDSTVNDEVEIVLPEVQFNHYTPRKPALARVASNERCSASTKASAFIRHVAFDVSDTRLAGAMRAGQCFGVIPPGVDARGKPNKVRLYSMASPTRGEDGQGRVIATGVKRLIDERHDDHRLLLGVASNYICDLQVGDEVQLTGPVGKRFLLPEQADSFSYVLFGTGTGTVPFRGMVLDLLEGGVTQPVVLIVGAPYATDLMYHQQFLELAERYRNFHYLTAISRQPQADGMGKMYVHDRLVHSQDLLAPILQGERTLVYMCGLTGMELGIYQRLAQLLSPTQVQRYLQVRSEALAEIDTWQRAMIGREIRRTSRVYTEVYD